MTNKPKERGYVYYTKEFAGELRAGWIKDKQFSSFNKFLVHLLKLGWAEYKRLNNYDQAK